MTKPLVSIIVPVFNTEERYLQKCLSVFDQPDPRLELLIVDDGSDEETRRLLEKLAGEVSVECRLVFQANKGQNAARNVGIKESSGLYLLFLDSDDYLDRTELERVMELLVLREPQVLGFNENVVDECGNVTAGCRRHVGSIAAVDKARDLLAPHTLASQVFRRDLFDGGYWLYEGSRVGEDLASVVPLIVKSDSYYGVELAPYNRVKRMTSITYSLLPEDALEILKSCEAMLKDVGDYGRYAVEIEWLCVLHVAYYGSMRVVRSLGIDAEARKRLFGFMDSRFPRWRANPIYKEERKRRGPGFTLLVDGHWRLYRALCGLRDFLSRTRTR